MKNYNFLQTQHFDNIKGILPGAAAVSSDGTIYIPYEGNGHIHVIATSDGRSFESYQMPTGNSRQYYNLTVENGIIYYNYETTIYRYDTHTKTSTSRSLEVLIIEAINVYNGNLHVGIHTECKSEFWTLDGSDLSTKSTVEIQGGYSTCGNPVLIGDTLYLWPGNYLTSYTIGSTATTQIPSNIDAFYKNLESKGEIERINWQYLTAVNGKISCILTLCPTNSGSLAANERSEVWYCENVLDKGSAWQEYSSCVTDALVTGNDTCNFFYAFGNPLGEDALWVSNIGSSVAINLDSFAPETYTWNEISVQNVYPVIELLDISAKLVIGEDVNNAGSYYFMYYDTQEPNNSYIYPDTGCYTEKPSPIAIDNESWMVFAHGEKLVYSSIGDATNCHIESNTDLPDSDWLVPVIGNSPNHILAITTKGLLYDIEVQPGLTFNITPYPNLDAPGNIHPFTDGTYLYLYNNDYFNFNIYKFGDFGAPFATTASTSSFIDQMANWSVSTPPATVPKAGIAGDQVWVMYGYENSGSIITVFIDKAAIDSGSQNIPIQATTVFLQKITSS